jgi:hypothetical protein
MSTLPLVSDELWAIVAPLLPPEPPKPKGGRPRLSDRAALTGILFVLHSGRGWELLPPQPSCGSGMTCWRRLRDWQHASGDLALNVFMDVTMVIGVGEGLRAAYVGARIAADVAEHVAADMAEHAAEDAVEHAVEHAAEHVGEDAVEHAAEDAAGVAAEAGGGCGLSFAAATLVATPRGERPIATLKVGQQVSAYDPTTGKTKTETITRVFLNHDTDRLDVTLAYHTASHAAGQTASPTSATGHGRQAPATTRDAMATEASAAQTEVIHTTASHPWLTTDRGWARAGTLHVGEAVQLLDGETATVVALQALPGMGAMWDLSLDATHTFAVGDVQAVVHNCGSVGNADATGYKGDPNNVAGTAGGVTFYNGQAIDAQYTDPWGNSGWTQMQGPENNPGPGLNKSQAFAQFIRQRYPNELVSNWTYSIERWSDPARPGEIIENHYWQNWSYFGEYYHHH